MSSLALTERSDRAAAFAGAGAYALAVFCAAALVFTVEPLVGKLTLPVLGGSPAVWNTSLAFFQIGLLGGYAYAHLLQKLTSLRRQALLHVAVLAMAGLTLPLRLSTLLGPPSEDAPALWLAGTLLLTLGAPFAALSATAPLLQAWFAKSRGAQDKGVYGLYAASNLGSLLALAAYPTLIEPLIGLSRQAQLWSLAYAVFLGGVTLLALSLWRTVPIASAVAAEPAPPISWRQRWIWMGLAACPASLLSGVTAHITADIASVPFLWIVPLELYLLSFILAFGSKKEGVRPWALILQLVSTPLALLALGKADMPWPEQLFLQLAAFFGAAMVCAQSLAASRPAPAKLTEFYLWLAVGGALGGGFNAFIAPLIFPEVWEYPAALVLAMLARPSTGRPLEHREKVWMGAGLFWIAPLLIPVFTMPDLMAMAMRLTPAAVAIMLRRRAGAVCILLAALAASAETQMWSRYTHHYRSFFGVTHLHEVETRGLGKLNVMVHGTTLHGAQFIDPARRCTPTTYYSPATLIGQVFATEHKRADSLSIGAVGLGVGTVASFVRPTDRMTLFEIDPLVARVATDPKLFSFVKGCAQGPTNIVIGDARQSLAKVPAQSYDLLMIDAFSSDSVPTHLLTQEAFALYLNKLKPDGVLLLHLSNRNLDLTGPAAATARALGATAREGWHWTLPQTSPYSETAGAAMLVAKEAATLDRYRDLSEWELTQPKGRPWTDDRTNVWGAMLAHIKGLETFAN